MSSSKWINDLLIIPIILLAFSNFFCACGFKMISCGSNIFFILPLLQMYRIHSLCCFTSFFAVDGYCYTLYWMELQVPIVILLHHGVNKVLENILVSSAKMNMSDFTCSGRSYINITNINGPSTLPSSIPLVTS